LIRTSPQSQYSRSAQVLIRVAAGEPVDRIAHQFRTAPVLGNRGSRLGERAWRNAQATLALKRGAQSEAIDLFRAALGERPLLFEADALEDCLANAYLELRRYDDAIGEYERILRLNPRYPLAHYRLALAYEGKGRPDLARKSYDEFLRVWAGADPDVPEIVNAQTRLAALH
jgi:tetratricopeptide (TPR) repeat protein